VIRTISAADVGVGVREETGVGVVVALAVPVAVMVALVVTTDAVVEVALGVPVKTGPRLGLLDAGAVGLAALAVVGDAAPPEAAVVEAGGEAPTGVPVAVPAAVAEAVPVKATVPTGELAAVALVVAA